MKFHAASRIFIVALAMMSAIQIANAAADSVMVSAKPLAMIYLALRPQQTVEILLPPDRDMHDYALSVADVRRMQQASRFFWLGPVSEPFLQPLARRFAAQGHWVDTGVSVGHAWLDQQQINILVANMASALAEQYPDEKPAIEQRRQAFTASLAERYRYWQQRLQPHQHKPFLLGHDAFIVFAADLGLQQAQLYRASHDHGHVQAGMHDLLALQKRVASGDIRCALEEPEVSFASLAKRYTTLKRERLEPMATAIALDDKAYVAFIDASALAFERCLQ